MKIALQPFGHDEDYATNNYAIPRWKMQQVELMARMNNESLGGMSLLHGCNGPRS